MSLIGVGSAAIDLILPKKQYKAGEYIEGCFLITGGIVDQKSKRVDCDLVMVEQSTGKEKVVDTTTVLVPRSIQPEETHEISFSYKVPYLILTSSKQISYRFVTKLTFNEGATSKDQDDIRII